MKNYKLPFFIVALLALTSCGGVNSFSNVSYQTSVTLIKNNHYRVIEHNQQASNKNANVAYLINGDSISYVIEVDYEYYLSGVDYSSYTLFYIGDSRYSLTLEDINYSIRVRLLISKINDDSSSSEPQSDTSSSDFSSSSSSSESSSIPQIRNKITYDANGGEYILYNGYRVNEEIYSLSHHPRPNTSIGTNIMKRDGYTLFGWNTQSNGGGEHIGLGSRYLDLNNDSFTLYAEWIKNDEPSAYRYTVSNQPTKHVIITQYLGDADVISVPEYIDDTPVTEISSQAFKFKNARKVFLPKTIESVLESSFVHCAFQDLYIFDNVKTISDDSFQDCDNFSTIHINAINKPKFVTADRHSPFADKIDNIIVNNNKKKIVVAGGSGAYYSVDACELTRLYPGYEAYNVAINGWFNNFIQLDILNHFLNKDDVLIHSVEMCGEYQFLSRNEMGSYDENDGYDTRFFNCFELNYDLLSLADIRKVSHLFDVFASFNKSKEGKPDEEYYYYTLFADERGDYSNSPDIRKKITPHAVYGDNGEIIITATISDEGTIDRNCYTEEGLEKLNYFYQEIRNRGVISYFTFACVNKDSLSAADKDEENIAAFERDIGSSIGGNITMINRLSDALLDHEWFADSDWHLDYEHAIQYTNLIKGWIGDIH